jgi:hypothetical protein
MVSLFIFLVLHFNGVKLTSVAILLIVRNWASWSDRPLTMGNVQEEFNLALSIQILSMAVLGEF